ncbi:hypothetical protein DSO57_1017509 [Entomophthora muscae]|uniref:Uncharacterized protein n=1 Tax=Entomophthora muscae TaxID=34485 RepID=A0ACC2SHI5_9FUNG|nr:hypothetical protein DSO57_1017509 [Entomophthora muscae]
MLQVLLFAHGILALGGIELPYVPSLPSMPSVPKVVSNISVSGTAEKIASALKHGQGIKIRNNLKVPPLELVERYTWFTAASYCFDDELENWGCYSCTPIGYKIRFVKGITSDLAGTRAYVALDDTNKRIVLAFRATENNKNLAQTHYLLQVPFLEMGDPSIMVAHGPLLAAQSLFPSIAKIISAMIKDPSLASYKLAIVGHSSGSTAASLTAAFLRTQLRIKGSRMEVYAYGMPRTGNFRYADWYNQQEMAVARVVNANDKFPHIIDTPGNYFVHHQNELWVRGKNRDGRYNITVCDRTVYEDPKCSNSIPEKSLSGDPHTVMFDVDYFDDLC